MPAELNPLPASTRAPGRRGVRAFLAAWFVVMAAICASLLARHLVPLPRPTNVDELGGALSTFRPAAGSGTWVAVHILYAGCRCSRRVAEHLAAKPRPERLIEHVIIVGDDGPLDDSLTSRGFIVHRASERQLAAWHIEAVPMFVVLAPSGAVRYAGGYTERKQGLFPRDVDIIASLRSGADVPALPIFGCAVSDTLKRAVNPLRLP